MRYLADIQKIEREKRQKKREEMCDIGSPLRIRRKMKREKRQNKREEMHEIASPLKIKRKMKAHIPTRPKDLPESRES